MNKIESKKPVELFYDIETSLVSAYIWRCGEQVIRHNQLIKKNGRPPVTDIICITYCFNDGNPAKVLHWGYEEQNSSKIVAEFDKIISQADIVIGKNNGSFDNKHLNTHRLLNPESMGLPNWTQKSDDLEKQIRKNFNLQSYSL